jgi:glutathione S-transferase
MPWSSWSPRAASVPEHVPSPDVARELVLFGYAACPYCRRVQVAQDRLGLSVSWRDTLRDREARAELVALTGRTQVPMLLIDGQPLLESLDIVAWLEAYAVGGAAARR